MPGRDYAFLVGTWWLAASAVSVEAQPSVPVLPDVRSIDGTGNNVGHPQWGSAAIALSRRVESAYVDGISAPPGDHLLGTREISNIVAAQSISIPDPTGVSDFVWQWGQFVDHDIDLTGGALPPEPLPIPVPLDDPYFDPDGTGAETIAFFRSAYAAGKGPRQQRNEITSYIDGSNVYGSDTVRAAALRTLDGTGRLRTSAGDLLPYNTDGLPNAPTADDPTLFLAGDVRANEQVGLIAMHTLFMREHNQWADWIRSEDPSLSGDEVFGLARAIVGAEIQVITYRDFLPIVLGPGALGPQMGYVTGRDPGIANVFSTAAYRFGHSMLSPTLRRLDDANETIPEGDLPLRDAFFAPGEFVDGGAVEPLLRGLASQRAQRVDTQVVDAVRNFLFGPPGAGGFDLAALNLQRGRDHGLPRYDDVRETLGLSSNMTWSSITSDLEVQARLAAAYPSVKEIDVWVGGLAEDPVPGALVGELFRTILRDQFELLRDCDRYWYEWYFSREWVDFLETQTLTTIIRRNTTIGDEIGEDVFYVPGAPVLTDLALDTDGMRMLGPPHPNPSTGGTWFDLRGRAQTGPVAITVYDVAGRRVASVANAVTLDEPVFWDGRDGAGHRVAPGAYLVEVRGRDFRDSRRVVQVR